MNCGSYRSFHLREVALCNVIQQLGNFVGSLKYRVMPFGVSLAMIRVIVWNERPGFGPPLR